MHSSEMPQVMIVPPRLGEVINHARHARRLTLCRLADQVTKEDGTPISPQCLFDIAVQQHGPAPIRCASWCGCWSWRMTHCWPLRARLDAVTSQTLEAFT